MGFYLLFICLSGVVIVPLLLAWLRRGPVTTPWFLALALLGWLLTGLLKANAIPPRTWYGVGAHVVLLIAILSLILVTAFLLQRHPQASNPAKKARYVKILTAWGLITVSLLSLEILFRMAPVYDTLAVNPGIKFFWPDWLYYRLNNFNYREPPFDANKADNTYRILLVGDSFVEGAGLSRNQTLGFRLEQNLNRDLTSRGLKCRGQVYSLGHCGYNTQQEVEEILKVAPQLHPDMIILGYVLNDPDTTSDMELTRPPLWMKKVHRLFLTEVNSYGYYWFFTHFSWFRTKFRSMEEILVALHDKEYVGWKITVDSLNTLENFNRQHRVDGMGIIFPYILQRTYSPPMRAVHRQVSLAMQSSGLEAVDLLPVSERQSPDLRNLRVSNYDSHPNAAACRIWGKYVAEVIRSRPSYVNWQRKVTN